MLLVRADGIIGVIIPAKIISTAYHRPILWLRNDIIAITLAIKCTTMDVMKHQRNISAHISKLKKIY